MWRKLHRSKPRICTILPSRRTHGLGLCICASPRTRARRKRRTRLRRSIAHARRTVCGKEPRPIRIDRGPAGDPTRQRRGRRRPARRVSNRQVARRIGVKRCPSPCPRSHRTRSVRDARRQPISNGRHRHIIWYTMRSSASGHTHACRRWIRGFEGITTFP